MKKIFLCIGLAVLLGGTAVAENVGEIVEQSGVQGGLVVHLGCGDGKTTAALKSNGAFMVHGLDPDAALVEKARRELLAKGEYGPVSFAQWTGDRLPYIDNFVNLLVAEKPGRVGKDEMMRVLAPHGVLMLRENGKWVKTVKPRPKEIDDWTHYLYGPGNNAVSKDMLVGPPRRMQWVGGPRYSRHHDRMSSITAAVSAGGRIFYVIDEAPPVSILTAFSAQTGEKLWDAPHPLSGYMSPEDVLVLDGVVWFGATLSGYEKGNFKGYDVKTGELVGDFDPDVESYWFHHRCHRGKATEKYLIMSRVGIEYVDPTKETWDLNHWVRGACLYGVMPANGLTYAPQHPCACYLESKLSGFNALAAGKRPPPDESVLADRLLEGEAYRFEFPDTGASEDDWPTFRGDNARRGCAKTPLPPDLQRAWTAKIGGRLSTSIVAGGRVYLASIDHHTVYALKASSGEKLWRFTAGGRVDSPPTFWKGRVLFGSADGYVYCLKADDGKLVWRFRAAPIDQRVMSFEQLESVWPVHGSVLVEKDVAWCVAGRSIFLDGGLRLLRLDPATGELLSETILDETDQQTGRKVQDFGGQLNMPTALPDILSCDGKHVYMHSQPFALDGTRLPLEPWTYVKSRPDQFSSPVNQNPAFAHIFSPTGFLDDTDRTPSLCSLQRETNHGGQSADRKERGGICGRSSVDRGPAAVRPRDASFGKNALPCRSGRHRR